MISCPQCGHRDSSITASYERKGFYERRRRCNVCSKQFVTREFSSHSIKELLVQNQEQALSHANQLFGGK